MSKVACGVPQPNITNPATAALRAPSRSAGITPASPPRADLRVNLPGTKPASELGTLSSLLPTAAVDGKTNPTGTITDFDVGLLL
jgi:hypothetical protein